MKIAVECRSVLLQKALERFLSKYLTSVKQAEIVVRDFKEDDQRSFYIASTADADLTKPFSKSQLVLALQNRLNDLPKRADEMEKETHFESRNFEILEKRIEMLTEEYKKNILEAIKAFYG